MAARPDVKSWACWGARQTSLGCLIVIADGRVVEQGTHEQLMGDEKGVYRNLYQVSMRLQTI